MRLRMSAALVLALVGALSIGCSGITDPSQNTVESFAGTVQVGGARAHWFSASKTGEIAIKVLTLTPASSSFIGVEWVQGANDQTCSSSAHPEQSSSRGQHHRVSGRIVSGPYCVIMRRALTQPTNYSITVSHPEHGRVRPRREIDDLYRLPLAEFTAARSAGEEPLKNDAKLIKALAEADVVAVGRESALLARPRHHDRLMKSGEAARRAIAALEGRAADVRAAAGSRTAAPSARRSPKPRPSPRPPARSPAPTARPHLRVALARHQRTGSPGRLTDALSLRGSEAPRGSSRPEWNRSQSNRGRGWSWPNVETTNARPEPRTAERRTHDDERLGAQRAKAAKEAAKGPPRRRNRAAVKAPKRSSNSADGRADRARGHWEQAHDDLLARARR